ncbi:OmpA-like domain-containing protein, DUF4398 [Desulfonema limicola]|uniref:OmpA-like domain-containing protein, DUF4398 n=1 Tax=Desulfonema limicola TaxID=45656 RepID=A0A975BCJ8_9BACT|nr:OmpA family protein [Desulfonema limicola]QTA82690.1 OmpA-like domain-containing protein, DUF4398 [Desulfonema limicola]
MTNHFNYKSLILILTAAFTLCVFMFGCSTAPPPALIKARAAYEHAVSSPGIAENAQVPMHEAKKALAKANEADDEDEMTHLASLAQKKIEYAVAVAEKNMADKKIEQLDQEKHKVLLDTRQYEIERARKDAELKAQELERKAMEAEAAQKKAQEAQMKAMKMQMEAEAAKKDAEARAMEIENLKKKLSELQATQTDRGLVLTLGDVLFASGKSELMPGAMLSIDKLVMFLKENPKRNLLIEGHTDSVGSAMSNLALSQQRAESVRMALLARGLDNSRITTRGYGENYPIADNSINAGRQKNRRVEIIILNEGISGNSMLRN